MISDPRTTPDAREARIAFGVLVAAGAYYVQFRLFRTNGLLWSLFRPSPLVPPWTGCSPGTATSGPRPPRALLAKETSMQRSWPILAGSLLLSLCAEPALAFCGFYVAKADTKLFNRASQVAIVRDGDRTVMTMANDFQGDPTEFAMVIPVPTVVKREQIAVAEKALLSSRRLFVAAARRVPRPQPVRRGRLRRARAHGYAAPAAPMVKMQDARTRASASPSRPATPWGSTTS